MIEVVVIIALLALIGWEKYQNRIERAKYLNAILGKNVHEIASLDLADKTKIVSNETVTDNQTPIAALDDEAFMKQLEKEENG